jgi:hypothetical protein
LAKDGLYRDANSLIYGDNKPSEEAIDRVVSKLNKECVILDISLVCLLKSASLDKKAKFSRKRANADEGDITYINEHNRVFNKKVSYYFACVHGKAYVLFLFRLPAITTNTQKKFAIVSSEEQHYEAIISLFDFCIIDWTLAVLYNLSNIWRTKSHQQEFT